MKTLIILLLLLLYPMISEATPNYEYDDRNAGFWIECQGQKILVHTPDYSKMDSRDLAENNRITGGREPDTGVRYIQYQGENLHSYWDGVNWIECCEKESLKPWVPIEKDIDPVPIPAAFLLLGSGIVGLMIIRRK